jgi:hypothetical protein
MIRPTATSDVPARRGLPGRSSPMHAKCDSVIAARLVIAAHLQRCDDVRAECSVVWSDRRRRAPREIIPAPVSISESANRAKWGRADLRRPAPGTLPGCPGLRRDARDPAGTPPGPRRDPAGTLGTSPGRPGLRRDVRDFAETSGTSPADAATSPADAATSPAGGATSPADARLRPGRGVREEATGRKRRGPGGSGQPESAGSSRRSGASASSTRM